MSGVHHSASAHNEVKQQQERDGRYIRDHTNKAVEPRESGGKAWLAHTAFTWVQGIDAVAFSEIRVRHAVQRETAVEGRVGIARPCGACVHGMAWRGAEGHNAAKRGMTRGGVAALEEASSAVVRCLVVWCGA